MIIKRIWNQIKFKRKKQIVFLLMLIIIASFFEVLSIGAIIPFLAALSSPGKIFEINYLKIVLNKINIYDHTELLQFFSLIFGVLSIIAGGVRLVVLWVSARLTAAIGSDLSELIFYRTINQPYKEHVSKNSSDIISIVATKINEVVYGVIYPALTLLSATIMLGVILTALISINLKIALMLFIVFGSIYFSIIKITKSRLLMNSVSIASQTNKIVKTVQEGLGGIREVIMDGSQAYYISKYINADIILRKAQASNQFIGGFPRYGIESLGMLLIALFAYQMTYQDGGIEFIIPVIGSIALAAQRMLPLVQQIYASFTSIRSTQYILSEVLILLERSVPSDLKPNKNLNFEDSIVFKNIYFKYENNSKMILSNVNFKINKGAKIGIVGETGSGKSTILDLLMGLNMPENGLITIDGIELNEDNLSAWRSRIAHVPQNIYLADMTIAENIAFGVPKEIINMQQVYFAAKQAQIGDFVESLPLGYNTPVGERGELLSGGQRQRIGIARALYKNVDILVLDEATSALDTETEHSVMSGINSLKNNLTLIIAAHRLSTLSECDKILKITNEGIQTFNNIQEMIGDMSE